MFVIKRDDKNYSILLENLEHAIYAATQSTCAKSKRGVAIFEFGNVRFQEVVMANNSPPKPFICTGTEKCKESCGKVAIHAEERAIMRSLRKHANNSYDDFAWQSDEKDMVHIKVIDGKPVASTRPSCWMCSRKLVEAKMRYMFMVTDFDDSGGPVFTGWTVEEFHEETLKFCDLEVGKAECVLS